MSGQTVIDSRVVYGRARVNLACAGKGHDGHTRRAANCRYCEQLVVLFHGRVYTVDLSSGRPTWCCWAGSHMCAGVDPQGAEWRRQQYASALSEWRASRAAASAVAEHAGGLMAGSVAAHRLAESARRLARARQLCAEYGIPTPSAAEEAGAPPPF